MDEKRTDPHTTPPEGAGVRAGEGQETPVSLLERLRANDAEAWSRLSRLYRSLVLFWCRRGGAAESDAEDVTQEVFAAVASGLEQFRRDRPGDSFRAWLRGITRNQLLMHFRRQGGEVRAEGGSEARRRLEDVADTLTVPCEGEAEEIAAVYRRALDLTRGQFEERTWQAFWRTVIQGLSPAAVESELGMSSAAIRQAKSRVLRRLRQELGELLD